MQWDDVVKKAASAKKKGAWHVNMVNIMWIKRKNHLHFAMQMVKSVEVAGFEPAAFWSRSAVGQGDCIDYLSFWLQTA